MKPYLSFVIGVGGTFRVYVGVSYPDTILIIPRIGKTIRGITDPNVYPESTSYTGSREGESSNS